jgi:RimJ/RimL family protein N-acetyltransferase
VPDLPRFDRLTTERLVLRRWRAEDRADFAALNADPEVMRHFPGLRSRAESDASVDRFEAAFETQGYGLWALEIAATGAFIGFTGLDPIDEGIPGHGALEVGWRLAKEFWHHGYATEAARACVGLAFGSLAQETLYSYTSVTNTASQAVMLRLGMVEWCRFEHPAIAEGHPVRPHVSFRLRRSDLEPGPATVLHDHP